MNDAHTGERIIVRGDERWVVREIDTTKTAGTHGTRCLICESDEIVRRVWDYPEDWDRLSDEALLDLCSSPMR